MSDIGDLWIAIRGARQEEKRARVLEAPAILTSKGFVVEQFNDGQHLRVNGIFDYWPSTELFMHKRTKRRGHGIKALVKALNAEPLSTEKERQ